MKTGQFCRKMLVVTFASRFLLGLPLNTARSLRLDSSVSFVAHKTVVLLPDAISTKTLSMNDSSSQKADAMAVFKVG